MKNAFLGALCGATMIGFSSEGWAHISVSGSRTLNGGSAIDNGTYTVADRTASSSFGWADGTDNTFGDAHRLTIFKFTLGSVQDVTFTATGASGLLPGFSLYSGIYPTTPLAHDGATVLVTEFNSLYGSMSVSEPFTDTNSNVIWNVGEAFTDTNGNGVYDTAGLGNSGKEGAFRALTSWHIYNDEGDRTDFTYIGHAADGTTANYGSFGAVNGDGNANGTVTASFNGLSAGDYFLFVGGAHYLAQNSEQAAPSFPTYGLNLTVQAVPESSIMPLLLATLLGVTVCRHRNLTRRLR